MMGEGASLLGAGLPGRFRNSLPYSKGGLSRASRASRALSSLRGIHCGEEEADRGRESNSPGRAPGVVTLRGPPGPAAGSA